MDIKTNSFSVRMGLFLDKSFKCGDGFVLSPGCTSHFEDFFMANKQYDFLQTKLIAAEYEKSWVSLIAYPQLLFAWQHRHSPDILRITTIASHRIRLHRFCDGYLSSKCVTVETFMKRELHKTIVRTLSHRLEQLPQRTLLTPPSDTATGVPS
jgi:hypothetical protein